MKHVLLIGCGAREHAIARAIARSAHEVKLTVCGQYINPAIEQLSYQYKTFDIAETEHYKKLVSENNYDFAIIGPEHVLAAGIVDFLAEHNVASIGPYKELAKIETSKYFCRELLQKYQNDALPRYDYFDTDNGLRACIDAYHGECVIKADGLMGGKGVYVHGSHFDSADGAYEIAKKLLSAGHHCLVEQKLVGVEFSLISFSDGRHLKHMPIVQDNKRAYFDDKGPNTGGMGSISFDNHGLPFLTTNDIQKAQKINERAVEGLQEECSARYCGVLYGGYMATADGVKLIEFNARFGDPEAVNLLPLLSSDFVDICLAMIEERLDKVSVEFCKKATVCKYVVPQGYPNNPKANSDIVYDIEDEALFSASVTHSETSGAYRLLGSRAVAALGIADTVAEAEAIADKHARCIKGDVFYRKDIGTEALIDKRNQLMARLR